MKKTLTGAFLALTGSIWSLAILVAAGNNLLSSWNTDSGRFWSTVSELKLTVPFVLSVLLTVLGIAAMAVEYFRKEK